MLKLDHLTVIAPTLAEGVAHVRDCLGIEVPFGTRHLYMGSHNHRLQLGDHVYLEIVARDPAGVSPGRARWFGLDNQEQVRADWDAGRRLRGWVANVAEPDVVPAQHRAHFGAWVGLPMDQPAFGFTIPADGALPLEGAAPSLIDHRDDPTSMAEIPDFGARLVSLVLEHPRPAEIAALHRDLAIDRPPMIVQGDRLCYHATIETSGGLKELR